MDDVIDSRSREGLYAEAGGSEAKEDKQTSNDDSVDAEDSAGTGVISKDEAAENTMDGTEEDEDVVKDPADENNKFGDSPVRGSGTEDCDEDGTKDSAVDGHNKFGDSPMRSIIRAEVHLYSAA
jgi:hypothetical protein